MFTQYDARAPEVSKARAGVGGEARARLNPTPTLEVESHCGAMWLDRLVLDNRRVVLPPVRGATYCRRQGRRRQITGGSR